jgi:RHS repeat-associated protein
MTYDNSRRVLSITENGLSGYVTNFGYDVYGNVISTSKQLAPLQWQTTTATYSGIGDLLTTTDPMGFVTTHVYNALGQRISTTDPELRQRQFQYDSAGRLLVLIDANGVAEETRTYNAAGYLDTIKDARNNLTSITRDGFGRALQVTYPGGSFESYTFDVSGNPLTHRMRNGNVITNTFDVLGRIATKSPQGQAVVTFSYDNASRLLSVSTPVVANNPASGVFSHGYDTAGRLISETNPQAQVMGYTLDANGNTTRITHPGGYFVDRVYDQLDRLTNIKLNGSANSSVVFGYDQLSRRTSKNYLNGANTTYSYDLGNNLLTMNIAFVGSACNWTYTYNKVHQMLSQNCSDTSYYWRATAGTVNYAAANNLNQYPQVGALAATYNTLGALATYNTWTYSYNTEQMLTAATKAGTSASFVYDPKLRQIQKTVGSTKTKYIYSGSHMMEERNGATNALTRRYVYADADEPVLQMTSAGVVTYIHHDHHGSVIAQSNATTGAVGNKYKYGPFGESAATLTGTTIGYTGQRYDTELGLYYYRARYFHQGLGRFLQPDPVGYQAGMNLYAYCQNDGLNRTDPTGLTSREDALKAVIEGVWKAMQAAPNVEHGGAVGHYYNDFHASRIVDGAGAAGLVDLGKTIDYKGTYTPHTDDLVHSHTKTTSAGGLGQLDKASVEDRASLGAFPGDNPVGHIVTPDGQVRKFTKDSKTSLESYREPNGFQAHNPDGSLAKYPYTDTTIEGFIKNGIYVPLP